MRRLDRLLIPFISGWILFKLIGDYGWWSLLIIPGCFLVGVVVFEGIARFYINRRHV